MHRQRNIYQSRTLDLLRDCLSDRQDGGCKQRGQTATIWLKALLMPRLAVCSRDLHWHWINWTLLCDTMEVSMLRLAWLCVCSSPHWQVGSSWFREKLSPANRNKGYRGEQISRKIVSRELNAMSYRDFAKNIALGHHVCKIREIGEQKNGVQHATAIYPIPWYTRPRYIGLTLYYELGNDDMELIKLNHIDGSVQERRNSSALPMELRLSCTNSSICAYTNSWK